MALTPSPNRVNRAPVLTLWATVVAERLGYPAETALTLGRFVAGSSARAKARSLGIIEEDARGRRTPRAGSGVEATAADGPPARAGYSRAANTVGGRTHWPG